MVIRFSKETVEIMLRDFQHLCDNKMVKKLPYDTWKSLKKMVETNKYIYVYPADKKTGDAAHGIVSEKYNATKDLSYPCFWFRFDDKSFGYYLDIAWDTYPANAIKFDDNSVVKCEDKLSYVDVMEDIMTNNTYLTSCSTADAAKIATCSTSLNHCDAIGYDTAISTEYGSYYTTNKTTSLNDWSSNKITIAGDVCCSKGDNISLLVDTKVDTAEYQEALKDIYAEINKDKPMLNKEKEKNMFKFDFGSCADNHNIRMSMYGLAVKNRSGNWVSYDTNSGQIMDVDILNFDSMNRYMYRVPVAIKDIAVGDVLIHNGRPVFVSEITEQAKIVAIDVIDGEEKIVMPLRSMFGFNYATKVVSLMDMCGTPSVDQPFGNMWMLALADGKDFDPMMLMLMNGGKMDMSNPMMMYMLMNKSKGEDIMPLLLMMNMNK